MGPIKITRVVSFSSEDPNLPAENLTKSDTYKKWRCKVAGEPKAWVELQLENLSSISSVDIGNYGSAFIEVLVGRTGNTENEYKVLVHSSTFMTPQECRNETNLQRVRIFKCGELNKSVLDEKWDRIRVVCTQPFNKQLQYGVSFITIHSDEEINKLNSIQDQNKFNFGLFKLKEDQPNEAVSQGSIFSKYKSLKPSPSQDLISTKSKNVTDASKSLAAAALDESERDALKVLRPSPSKIEERPNINLMDKLKSSQEIGSINSKGKSLDLSPLPRRKFVDVDNICEPVKTSVTPPSRKGKEKATEKLEKRELEKKKERTPSGKKTPNKETPKTVDKKRKSTQCIDSEEKQAPAKKKRKTKPFNRLLEGAVVVLSGFQNPLRSQLRDKLQAMGAKYKPDWGPTCTHLVCAFYNTPKFREVKGKGKIVTKDWVEECFSRRRRFPWRRYCLDKSDRGDESEEEIYEGEENSPGLNTPSTSRSVINDQKQVSPKSVSMQKKLEDEYGDSTEVDEPDTDDEIQKIKMANH